ncbi:MAG: hypothetical protein KF773_07225 [Deltaproteobacteria bacterium]|nr:hypothetical protein [Deltaproteobacteria bacterium]
MSVVVVSYTGWVQVRLATNPDPTDEPRGVSGYTFALPGEPDLDRILRSSNPVAPRTHGPPIGLAVTRVTVDGTAVATHPLVGARVDLLGDPMFESVNEVVYAQGVEPLEPFELSIAHGAFHLQRRAFLDLANPAATVYTVPRSVLAARAATFSFSTDLMQEATGCADPVAFRHHRLELLQADLRCTHDPTTTAGLRRRISELQITDPDDHRTVSMQFIEARHFTLDGPLTFTDPSGWLTGLDTFATFAADLVMGSWDADALSAYTKGTITLTTY